MGWKHERKDRFEQYRVDPRRATDEIPACLASPLEGNPIEDEDPNMNSQTPFDTLPTVDVRISRADWNRLRPKQKNK